MLLLSQQKEERPFSETKQYLPRYLKPLKTEQEKVSALFWGSICTCTVISQLTLRNVIPFGLEVLTVEP